MQSLPIDSMLSQIVEAVRTSANVVLTATPGAGKTTRLPPELLAAVKGRIQVLQPRRMAAVAASHRIAEERGWLVGGDKIGYQVRFESRLTEATRLIFLTDALALRKLIENPELNGTDLVIIDEFHERNLNQDIMLGAVKELQELGRDIKLLIMSATLESDKLLKFLPNARLIEVPGKVFPLEIRHGQQPLSLRTDYSFYDRVTSAIENAAKQTQGDILVFLPGVGEIQRTSERLSGLAREVQILHGSLPLQEQQRVLKSSTQPRVILSTNVAEASVTVDGVDCVIDTGLAKVMQINTKTGFSQLELGRISQFNARQRAGRAARQKSGTCIRLWTPHEEVTQAVEMVPEVQRSDLSQTLLLLSHWGVTDFSNFAWLDDPPPVLLSMAIRSLGWLGAFDSDHRLTELGRRLLDFPLPPRWSALMALGEQKGEAKLAAQMAALLNERDILGDRRSAPTTRLECDLLLRLEVFNERKSDPRMRPVKDAAEQLEKIAKSKKHEAVSPRELLLLSQRDRLCRRRSGSDRALMIGGRGVRLSPESQVKKSEFFIALQGVDIPGQPDTTISLACGVSKELLLQTYSHLITTREDIYFDESKMKFYARRGRFLEDLPIDEPTLSAANPEQVSDKMTETIVERWGWLLENHENLKDWSARLNFFNHHRPESALAFERVEAARLMAYGRTSLQELLDTDLVSLTETALGRNQVVTLNNQTPTHFQAPSGNSHKIDYSDLHAAYVNVRLQELFGLAQTPKVLNGKLPITFRLLGPNYRPVQVTSDLAGFWQNSYFEVRKELRARYPKHSWPDDPLKAEPPRRKR